jgi:hypothetical protein
MCTLCGGPLTDDLCLRCLAAIDDHIHYLMLAEIAHGLPANELQKRQFRQSLRRYWRTRAREEGHV